MGGKMPIFIDKFACILVGKRELGNLNRRLRRLKVDPPMGGKIAIFIDWCEVVWCVVGWCVNGWREGDWCEVVWC